MDFFGLAHVNPCMNSLSFPNNSRLMALSTLALAIASFSLVISATSKADFTPTFADKCALPAEIDFANLSQSKADELATRAGLCVDYEAGRLSKKLYLEARTASRASISVPTKVERLWATSVIASSSEYSPTNWSAQMAIGPANVYPSFGDHTLAWASESADGQVEFLELAVPGGRIGGIEVYETFNPGAITSIETISVHGERNLVYNQAAVAKTGSSLLDIDFNCTREAVVAVRITVDSAAVPGWNEIDAVAVKPCH